MPTFALRALTTAYVLLATLLANAQAVDDELIARIREQTLENLDAEGLGAGYAAMLSFAVSPDISAATFYPDAPDGIDDVTLKVYRVPLRHVFDRDGQGPRPFVQGLFAYQYYDARFILSAEEAIGAEWRTYGGALTGGVELPVSERLTVLTGVTAGIGRMRSDADYSGSLGQTVLRPVLEGIAFDWDADARLFGASLGFDYLRPLSGFDLEIRGSATHHYIETYNSSSAFVEFTSHVTALDVDVNSVHPTAMSLGESPLSLVLLAGGTKVVGPNREALGFDSFFELGAAFEADISTRGWRVRTLRLGAKGIVGNDVRGWSLVFGYGF